MKYCYEDLSPEQMEDLVIALCHFVLGAGVQGFARGPDGGRDGKFIGTANELPSKAAPWKGTTIIQSKHTNESNATFSDTSFYSDDNADTVLGNELPRIKKLRDSGEMDHYLLVSNRRLTGNAEAKLRLLIATECGLPVESVMLCGIKDLEMFLKVHPQAAALAKIDPIDSPLFVSPDALAEVVEHLAKLIPTAATAFATSTPTARISYAEKNKINKMSPEFASELRKRYLKETAMIREFLAAPENDAIVKHYDEAAEEFKLKIIAKRKHYQSFDDIFDYLMTFLVGRDPILRRDRRLTRALLFYMYWNCDIGSEDAAATQ